MEPLSFFNSALHQVDPVTGLAVVGVGVAFFLYQKIEAQGTELRAQLRAQCTAAAAATEGQDLKILNLGNEIIELKERFSKFRGAFFGFGARSQYFAAHAAGLRRALFVHQNPT